MNRRNILIFSVPAAITAIFGYRRFLAWIGDVNTRSIFEDPEALTAGNLAGDVTIVAFLDYNCPYCKQAAPDLDRVVEEDGKVRLVYKDWPILSDASIYGAELALAAKYQDKYVEVHRALMAIRGGHVSKEQMLAATQACGVDMPRLLADLTAHVGEISAILARNTVQAEVLGLRGTPSYLIGPFMASALDYPGFEHALLEARRHKSENAGTESTSE